MEFLRAAVSQPITDALGTKDAEPEPGGKEDSRAVALSGTAGRLAVALAAAGPCPQAECAAVGRGDRGDDRQPGSDVSWSSVA